MMENINEKEYLIEVGERLRQQRILEKVSQEQIAAKIGISKTQYSKIERGLANTSIATLVKIVSAFDNLSFDYLLANNNYAENECINILKNIIENAPPDEINRIKEHLLLTERLIKQMHNR